MRSISFYWGFERLEERVKVSENIGNYHILMVKSGKLGGKLSGKFMRMLMVGLGCFWILNTIFYFALV